MPDTIRIGVVGAGANTRLHHIPKLKKIEGVEIKSVVNRSRASSERVAQEFGIERVHDNWQEVVNDPGIDAVVIGTWPYMHCPVTLAALAAGKHVLTEARLAMNAAEARQMLAASRARPDLVTQVVPGPTTFAADPMVMHLLADGYIGELQCDRSARPDRIAEPRCADALADGPRLLGHEHHVDGHLVRVHLALGRAGDGGHGAHTDRGPVPRRQGTRRASRGQRARPRGGACRSRERRDRAAALELGRRVHARAGGVALRQRGHAAPGDARARQPALSGGRRGDKEMKPIAIPADKTYGWRVEEEFIGAIRGQEQIRRTSFVDAVNYMDFTEAVHISSREGRRVYLPLA